MSALSGADTYLLFALHAATLALAALGILWSARGSAVYLHILSSIFSAAYFLVFAGVVVGHGPESLLAKWAIGIGAVGGAWLKNLSLSLLETPETPPSNYLKGSVIVAIGILSLPFLFPDQMSFSTIVTLAAVGIMGRVCMVAYRIGSKYDSVAAKFFVSLVGLQLLGLMIGLVQSLVTNEHLLPLSVGPQSATSIATSLGLNLLNIGLFIVLVLDINIRLRERAQKELVALEVSRSRVQEREMLLADLHDGLGSQISTARLRVERGEMTQQEIVSLLRECSADLYLMVDTLREQNDSLEAALVDYKTRVERRISEQGIGLSWSVQLEGAPPMTARRMLQVMRVIQESISNALRHSGAKKTVVAVRYLGDFAYLIKVEDDGVGIAEAVSPGRGLSNMRRRARELGGSLDIRRRSGGAGTEVLLSFEDRPV